MPEKDYSFKPASTVRTFGQVVGHIADNQYMWCSAVKGEKKESNIEQTVSSKADLVAKLKEAVAYCDSVYSSFHDSDAAVKINAFGRELHLRTLRHPCHLHANQRPGAPVEREEQVSAIHVAFDNRTTMYPIKPAGSWRASSRVPERRILKPAR